MATTKLELTVKTLLKTGNDDNLFLAQLLLSLNKFDSDTDPKVAEARLIGLFNYISREKQRLNKFPNIKVKLAELFTKWSNSKNESERTLATEFQDLIL